MDLREMSNLEQRSVEAFFSRIRNHLEDIQPEPQGAAKPVTDRLKNLREDQKYGVVDKKQLDKILSKYDPSSDKPTKTNDPLTSSFAKLLYSKPGFHQMSSTDYLVEVLNIKDRDRDSFLGGHSTYETPENETLHSVKSHHHKMFMRNRSKELLEHIEKQPSDNNIDSEVKALLDKDPTNGNALAVWATNCLRKKECYDAVKYYKRSLTNNCDFIPEVKILLAEALHQCGFDLYNRRYYEKARENFTESLMNNPEHPGSRLHLEMCLGRIRDMNRRPGDQPNGYYKRRK